jgi:hypothetical protein
MIIAAMVDEATNDIEAIHVLIICATSIVLAKEKKWHGCGIIEL